MAEQALNDALRVVGFAGSLRRGSFNRALLEAARQLALGRMTISPIEIGELPFYNADVEAEGDPAAVVEFKAAIRAADGVIIATPEYNDGIPGVLTTAIDWGSRPPGIAGSPRLPQRIVKRRLFGQHLMYRGDRIEPSPTAEATRLVLPLRTSPTASTPGIL